MAEQKKGKVMVGLSGGVDSAVAALLLRDAGYEVVGGFMKNWSDTPDPTTGECGWKVERRDALRVAAHLDIPFMTFDFEKEYRERVLAYMVREYAAGRTPNPDVLCNREVKFDPFLAAARDAGCDMIATGHYARTAVAEDGTISLLAGVDPNKDQSYFLHRLTQEQLAHTLFPIGQLQKAEVRRVARDAGLPNAEKKDSQGLCFVGKVDLKTFLKGRIGGRPGPIVSTEGRVLGIHDGIAPYTIGQRHGFGGGGGEPCFVVEKDVARNTLVIAEGREPAALFASALHMDAMHWIAGTQAALPLACTARIRYRQPLQETLVSFDQDALRMDFEVAQRAVSPGQFAVLYDGERCLGGGIIKSALTE